MEISQTSRSVAEHQKAYDGQIYSLICCDNILTMLLRATPPAMLLGLSILLGSVLWGESQPPKELPLRQPAVRSVFPLGGQAGHKVALELEGDYLDRAAAVRCECPDLHTVVRTANALRIEVDVEIPASAEPGPRILYVESPRGASNRFLFRVTRWASVVEQEPNDLLERAQPVSTPAVVEGRIARLTDVDFYRFHASARERLAFNVMAARSKAPGFVSINLLTASGRELAHNNARIGPDPYLDYTFERDGDYVVVVTPRRFADFFTVVKDDQLINWQYQLAIGRSPMLWSVFPMGGRRGSHVDADLRADFLPAGAMPRISGVDVAMKAADDPCGCRYKLSIDISKDAPAGVRLLTVPDDSGNSVALGFAVGEEREITEGGAKPQSVELPVTINGRIAEPNEHDSYRFKVNQEDEVTFQLDARGLGSQATDPQLALLRAQGDIVRFADDRCQKCTPVDSVVRKKEMLDPRFTHAFISASANDADAAGEYDVVVLDNSSRGGENVTYRLTLRKKRPGYSAGVLADHRNARNGAAAKIPVAVSREEGFNGSVEIVGANLPKGWTARPLTLQAGQDTGDLEIMREEGGPASAGIEIRAKAKMGEQEMLVAALGPPLITEDGLGYLEPPLAGLGVWFVDAPAFSLKVEEPSPGFVIDLKKATRVEVSVTIERSSGFEGALTFQAENLPEGVTLQAQRVDGNKAILTIEADPQKVKTGRYRIAARAGGVYQGQEAVDVTSGLRLQVK